MKVEQTNSWYFWHCLVCILFFQILFSVDRALTGTIVGLELLCCTRNHRLCVIGYILLCLVSYVNVNY